MPEAQQEWARVVAGGFAVREGELQLFASYCQNFAHWQRAEKLLEEHGTEVVLRNDKGEVKSVSVSPQVGISRGALSSMTKAAMILGLRANLGTREAPGAADGKQQQSDAANNWFN